MAEKGIHIYIFAVTSKQSHILTYFEYLTTFDEMFAYALNRIEKKIAKATTSLQEKCVMMAILCLVS